MSTNWSEGIRPGFIGSKNIFAKIKPNQNIYIETGAWRGAGIKWAIENFNKVHSIELWEEYYNNMVELFKDNNKVHMHLGDSRTKLPELLSKIDEKCFIFLDAHGDINETGLNPLYEEIKEIGNQNIKNHIIVIDDLRRIGDPTDLCWGKISVDELKRLLSEVNKDYKIFEYNDMIIAATEEDLVDNIEN